MSETAKTHAPTEAEADAGAAAAELRAAAENARRLAEELRASSGALRALLQAEANAHPYRLVAIGAGVGFLVGGGLAKPIGRMLTRTVLGSVLVPALAEPLSHLVRDVIHRYRPDASDHASTPPPNGQRKPQ